MVHDLKFSDLPNKWKLTGLIPGGHKNPFGVAPERPSDVKKQKQMEHVELPAYLVNREPAKSSSSLYNTLKYRVSAQQQCGGEAQC